MKISIPIPENYSLPEDIEDGGILEELVTFRVEGDMLVPTMLAGVEIATDEAEAEDEAVAEMEGEEEASMAGMGERIMGMA